LGATICTPRNPECDICPVTESCAAFAAGNPEKYPVKVIKAAKPTRRGTAFFIQDKNGDVLITRRPSKGLLGGMQEIPGTSWTSNTDGAIGKSALPFDGDWRFAGQAKHTFTHFHLILDIWQITVDRVKAEKILLQKEGKWIAGHNLKEQALPTLMKKAIGVVLTNIFKG
jgi:A/G-specific adenine glycosylase